MVHRLLILLLCAITALFTTPLASAQTNTPRSFPSVRLDGPTHVPSGASFYFDSGSKPYFGQMAPKVAYVEKTGDDATAVIGDPARAYLTVQAALNACVALVGVVNCQIQVGIGAFAAVTLAADWPSRITIVGKGITMTSISSITGTTYNVSIRSDQSISLQTISAKSVTLDGCVALSGVTANSAATVSITNSQTGSVTASSTTGNVTIADSITGAVTANSIGGNLSIKRTRIGASSPSALTANNVTGTITLDKVVASTVTTQNPTGAVSITDCVAGNVVATQSAVTSSPQTVTLTRSAVSDISTNTTVSTADSCLIVLVDSTAGAVTCASSTGDPGTITLTRSRVSSVDATATSVISKMSMIGESFSHRSALQESAASFLSYYSGTLGVPVVRITADGPDATDRIFTLTDGVDDRWSWYVNGNALSHGNGGYLNFGTVVGTSGYGFHNNSGTMQAKDSGGSWLPILAPQYSQIQNPPRLTRLLASYYADAGNVTTTATTLCTYSVTSGTLSQNGDTITASYFGKWYGNPVDLLIDLKVTFAGTDIYDTTDFVLNDENTWELHVTLTRVSNTVVRAFASQADSTNTQYSEYVEITGLNLGTTAYPLSVGAKSTGTNAASNQTVLKQGIVQLHPAP